MGARTSSPLNPAGTGNPANRAATNGSGRTLADERPISTYFGPNFILESSNGGGVVSSNATAFWEDILTVLSMGGDVLGATQQIQNVYSQLPPPELKTSPAIQSNVNIQKSTLRLTRRKATHTANETIPSSPGSANSYLQPSAVSPSLASADIADTKFPNIPSPAAENKEALSYQLSFKFDSLKDTLIKIYWGGREKVSKRGPDGVLTQGFLDKNGRPVVPWTFGPFSPGLNQSFTIPEEHVIDMKMLKKLDMAWVSELDLVKSPVIVTEGEGGSNIAGGESMVSHSVVMNSTSTSAGLLPGQRESLSIHHPGESESVSLNIDNPSATVPNTQRRSIFGRKATDPYHLIIEIQAIDDGFRASTSTNSGTKSADSQFTFATFSSNNDKQLEVHFSKQLLIISETTYVLQEVFGFTETQSSLEVNNQSTSQKECVVCMADAKDTICLPCRHLCLCRGCADQLRLQGRGTLGEGGGGPQAATGGGGRSMNGPPKCPICRQIFHSLVHLSLPAPYMLGSARGSKTSLLHPTMLK